MGDLHEAPCEKCWAGLGFPLHDGPRLRQHHLVLLPPPGEKGPYSTQKCVFSSHWSVTKGEPFQGVTESTLGLLTGLSAVMGVAGARIFPIARFPNSTCLNMRRGQRESKMYFWILVNWRIAGSDLALRRLAVSDFSGSLPVSSSVLHRSNCLSDTFLSKLCATILLVDLTGLGTRVTLRPNQLLCNSSSRL